MAKGITRQGAGGRLFHSALYPPRDTKKRALPHPAGAASGRRVAGPEAQAPAHQRVYGGTAAAGGIPGNGRSPGEAAAHDTALGCRYRQTGQQSAGRGTLSPAQGTAGHATHIGRGQAHARRGCVSCGARHHAGHDGRPRIGPSELFKLRWEDVDLDAGIIRMPNARKGARADSRLIPVRDDVLPELRRWWEEDAKIDCPWVIHWQGKKVMCIGHAWHAARKAAGISRVITPYSLRHAFPTSALEYDADIKAVAEIMGHSDPSMLLKTYQHIKWKQLKKAISAGPGLGK